MKRWFLATRPWSFVVSASPVLAACVFLIWKDGTAGFDWINAVLALVGIILFHAAGNVLSDYYDYRNGIDSKDAFCVTNLISGEFRSSDYLKFSIWLFAAACIIGILLAYRSDILLLAIGLPGLVLTLLYSRAKFYALGDLLIFIVFGVLPMLGTSLVVKRAIDWDTLLLSIPIGLVTVAVLHANNTRDIPTDSKVGAVSFAGLIGGKASVYAYIAYIGIPALYTVAMVALKLFPVWCLLILLSVPIVVKNSKQALKYSSEGLSAFKNLDLASAQLQMISAATLILGFIIGSIL
ncbi:MAG: prenyltransferase [Bacteroidales bacterium]|nr:prenyltransferase [Bacteroidales bacterium]